MIAMPDIFDTKSLYMVFKILERKIWLSYLVLASKSSEVTDEFLVNALIFLENRVYLYKEVATNPTQVASLMLTKDFF